METKRNNILWAVSLIVIGTASLLLIGTQIAGAGLPDAVTRLLGVVDLAALALLGFTSVRKLRNR